MRIPFVLALFCAALAPVHFASAKTMSVHSGAAPAVQNAGRGALHAPARAPVASSMTMRIGGVRNVVLPSRDSVGFRAPRRAPDWRRDVHWRHGAWRHVALQREWSARAGGHAPHIHWRETHRRHAGPVVMAGSYDPPLAARFAEPRLPGCAPSPRIVHLDSSAGQARAPVRIVHGPRSASTPWCGD